MPRNMSVSLTEKQVRARTKTVTRRAGWRFLEPGTRLMLCRKVMGRRKDEPLVRIVEVEERVGRLRDCAIVAGDRSTPTTGFHPVDPHPPRRIDRWYATHRFPLAAIVGYRVHESAELAHEDGWLSDHLPITTVIDTAALDPAHGVPLVGPGVVEARAGARWWARRFARGTEAMAVIGEPRPTLDQVTRFERSLIAGILALITEPRADWPEYSTLRHVRVGADEPDPVLITALNAAGIASPVGAVWLPGRTRMLINPDQITVHHIDGATETVDTRSAIDR
ncbi:hypothetical protein [Nocardia bovistercoris]|uniref:ASCH domain-containing protein n=1 Tax=Nocardia bovistercoris TaxID=2785916 RepID=A0A931N742_9NOCA|nr:hypothetical protein [Nocardia bovistercoris]MBH0780368.1 hypothetical protein [Nocardia bovistercoris]